jgi:hypothetical protein
MVNSMTDVITYPRDSVLTDAEVAAALRISIEKLNKADVPTVHFGRDKRYIWGQVLDFLASKAA